MVIPTKNEIHITALAGMIGSIFFVLVFILEDIFVPGYEWLSTTVSEHSIGIYGWIQIGNFILTGILFLIYSIGLSRRFKDKTTLKIGYWFLLIFSACILASGPFVTDPNPVILFSSGTTWHGDVHGILGAIAFTMMPLSCLMYFLGFRKEKAHKKFAWWSLTACCIIFISIILLKIEQTQVLDSSPPTNFIGLYQRIILVMFFAWSFSLAMKLYRIR